MAEAARAVLCDRPMLSSVAWVDNVQSPQMPDPQSGRAAKARLMDDILRQHQPFLRRLARRLCRSSFDAEDLVQDALERAFQSIDRLAPEANHRAWMCRIMHNLFIDRLRHRASKPETMSLGHGELAAADAEEIAWWWTLEIDDIRARLSDLPVPLRTTFELFAFDGCSYEEIARRQSIPRATVGTRILRARRRLRELLGQAVMAA